MTNMTVESRLNDSVDEDDAAWVDNITKEEFAQYWRGENLAGCACGGRAYIGGRIIDGMSYPTVHCGICWVETRPARTFAKAKELWDGREVLTPAEMAAAAAREIT